MSETDITKMKVADLKRELKLRGLSTTGNKHELQDRLQTALIDGELSLEDTAISGEELLEEDVTVLTDEEEAKMLCVDENELLESPKVAMAMDSTVNAVKSQEPPINVTKDAILVSAPKKVVLKRRSSFTRINSDNMVVTLAKDSSAATKVNTAKENTEPDAMKMEKSNQRKPITMLDEMNKTEAGVVKVAQLSLEERLELRAKKFGITSNETSAVPAKQNGKTERITSEKVGNSSDADQRQIELLKRRAERFGCVVSSKIMKHDAEEKLEKRKERFGGRTITKGNPVWAEKARMRLERFKKGPSSIPATNQTAATGNGTVAKN